MKKTTQKIIGDSNGFTLIEIVMVIIILGILAGVATMQFGSNIDNARFEATKSEMNALVYAIVGNQQITSKGARSEFGFVGDVGNLPPNLDALYFNPGYATWNGPYMDGSSLASIKADEWGADYIFQDTLIRSVGSGQNIDKVFAVSTASLISNRFDGRIVDASGNRPSASYLDSVLIRLYYPDGIGGIVSPFTNPDTKGQFNFTGIPIGMHTLEIIYLPENDTLSHSVTINPGRDASIDIVFPADLW
ncbi:MAG: prepilin-type N-terminal cleavage/methylation domain-containing protein [candidate division Zixibacteria bacterium]